MSNEAHYSVAAHARHHGLGRGRCDRRAGRRASSPHRACGRRGARDRACRAVAALIGIIAAAGPRRRPARSIRCPEPRRPRPRRSSSGSTSMRPTVAASPCRRCTAASSRASRRADLGRVGTRTSCLMMPALVTACAVQAGTARLRGIRPSGAVVPVRRHAPRLALVGSRHAYARVHQARRMALELWTAPGAPHGEQFFRRRDRAPGRADPGRFAQRLAAATGLRARAHARAQTSCVTATCPPARSR